MNNQLTSLFRFFFFLFKYKTHIIIYNKIRRNIYLLIHKIKFLSRSFCSIHKRSFIMFMLLFSFYFISFYFSNEKKKKTKIQTHTKGTFLRHSYYFKYYTYVLRSTKKSYTHSHQKKLTNSRHAYVIITFVSNGNFKYFKYDGTKF